MPNMKTAVFAGIGRLGVPVVENLVDNGWRTVISYRPGHPSQETVEKLIENEGPDRVKGIAAEIVELSAAQEFVNAAIDAFGRMDALINIASGYPTEKDHWQRWQRGGQVTDDDWLYYDSNFTLFRNVILSALKSLDDPRGLSIINFGDARSLQFFDEHILDPYEGQGGILCADTQQIKKAGLERLAQLAPLRHINPYTLAKIDVAYLTRKLALDLGPQGVRVNAIAPGPMIPPPDSDGKAVDSIAQQTCLGKWGGLEPVVKAVDYLLDDDYVTGEILKVDGGLYLSQTFKNS